MKKTVVNAEVVNREEVVGFCDKCGKKFDKIDGNFAVERIKPRNPFMDIIFPNREFNTSTKIIHKKYNEYTSIECSPLHDSKYMPVVYREYDLCLDCCNKLVEWINTK